MPLEAPRRRWARLTALAAATLVPFILALVFAARNRPQPIRIDLGFWTWHGEAVHAVFAATLLGLVVMFLAGLPADLRARAEQRRLVGRVRALERELETERAVRRTHSDHGVSRLDRSDVSSES
jgi:uncharacterized integral membrane protein